ncbi:MAG TPA: hypothetical protein VFI69_07755 [Candidatus Limnocylindrales bacterium]|nr:hypothetical protein [Candidatus Limnocylindrales bacterium]
MRAMVLAGLLLAGCTAGPGATLPAATAAAPAASAASTSSPTPSPSDEPAATTDAPATVYTADDVEIAKLIRAGAETSVTQLKRLRDMDPSKLVELFVPLGTWIATQKTAVAAYTPSACTMSAVTLFNDGLQRYDAIRKKFLAWKDWGAHGNAYPPAAPREAAETLTKAVAELDAHCPA